MPASRLFLPVALLCLAACQPPPVPQQFAGETMGTYYRVTLSRGAGENTAEQAGAVIQSVLKRVVQATSTYHSDSEISVFNRREAGSCQSVSPTFAAVLRVALDVFRSSGGALDITVGPLVNRWGFGPDEQPAWPTQEEIDALLQQVGAQKLQFDFANRTLCKSDPVEIDLSAIAKGYAVDALVEELQSMGYADVLVDIGGELRSAGERPGGGPWRLAIEKPDGMGERQVQQVLGVSDAAVATSGDYRNFRQRQGRRLSHTIDPRTGWPVAHDTVSVTIIAPSAAYADAWATAINVLGYERAQPVVGEQELAAFIIVRDGQQYRSWASPAMAPYLQ